MHKKINRLLLVLFWLVFLGSLFYTRFVNLGWGLPYPMHPDERNMADAIIQLKCQLPVFSFSLPKSFLGVWPNITSWIKVQTPFDLINCFNPNFFAYGQLSLYLGYIIALGVKFFDGGMGYPISFSEGVLGLRILSAVSSVGLAVVVIKTLDSFFESESFFRKIVSGALIVFSPFAIQFAHFGTTESLLMFLYGVIVYLSLSYVGEKIKVIPFVLLTAITFGLSVGTKVSSLVFFPVPVAALIFKKNNRLPIHYQGLLRVLDIVVLFMISMVVFILSSPHDFINWPSFISSITYEKEVALGTIEVFYTRQFFDSIPIAFQLVKIFPFALGLITEIFALLGFFTIGWKDVRVNILRLAFAIYFLPNAFIFAKWTRFMAPVFPILVIFSLIFIFKIFDLMKSGINRAILMPVIVLFVIVMALPGLAYLFVYENPDVRVEASKWIYKNIPNESQIISETANVVDIPIALPTVKTQNVYRVISFDFYNLDSNRQLQNDLENDLKNSEYIFVPSRRIFENQYCRSEDKFAQLSYASNRCSTLSAKYPDLKKYYDGLFDDTLGFKKVAEFTSYPTLSINIWGLKFKAVFPDETAEETWSVFDHPVIRIYKRI